MMASIRRRSPDRPCRQGCWSPSAPRPATRKNERSESPGVAEKPNRSTVMSKSKPSRRARYCTGSTIAQARRRCRAMPRFLMNGMWCGSNVGSSIRNSMVMRSPFGSTRLPSLIGAAGVLEKLRRLAQQRAVLRPSRPTPAAPGLAEHLVRNASAERFEQRKLAGVRLALRHHVRVLEHRDGALVGAVHDRLVGPFEVEGVAQRLAHPRIGEFLRGAC